MDTSSSKRTGQLRPRARVGRRKRRTGVRSVARDRVIAAAIAAYRPRRRAASGRGGRDSRASECRVRPLLQVPGPARADGWARPGGWKRPSRCRRIGRNSETGSRDRRRSTRVAVMEGAQGVTIALDGPVDERGTRERSKGYSPPILDRRKGLRDHGSSPTGHPRGASTVGIRRPPVVFLDPLGRRGSALGAGASRRRGGDDRSLMNGKVVRFLVRRRRSPKGRPSRRRAMKM